MTQFKTIRTLDKSLSVGSGTVLLRTIALLSCVFLLTAARPGLAQEAEKTAVQDSREQILRDQMQLAEQYRLLEEKLFSLYQYEQDQNPDRAELLQRAYQQSKQRLTLEQFNQAIRMLGQSRLREAEKNQTVVVQQLEELLNLLQSEDRSKRVREEIDRFQEYLKEVNRLLRIQKGIRGQAENGDQSQRLKDSQQKNEKRTGDLADEIKKNEAADESSSDESQSMPDNASPDSEEQGQPQEQGAEGQPQEQGAEGQPGGAEKDSNPQPNNPQPNNPKAPGQPAQAQSPPQPGQPGQPAEAAPQQTPAPAPQNPVQQRLQDAQQKMREARDKLEQAKMQQSIDAMREAERELAEAKRELEEILRQLREEEIERTLASLENRFRQMLERQIKIYDESKRLGQILQTERNAEFEIQCGKLAVDEKSLVTEAARALLLLQDDGSSVAITETVRQLQQDMQQTTDRLSAAKVGKITLQIEEDIIESLTYLVDAFAQAQDDLEKQPQSPPPGGQPSPPGDQPLVDQLVELKLIRRLQEQIHKRHVRYAQLLIDPNDPEGYASDPDIQNALDTLSDRQAKLHQITRDIVTGKNK